MRQRQRYATQHKAQRAKWLGKSKTTPSVSVQALHDEQHQESGMTRDSALVQSGSLLEKVWGTRASSPIQAKALQQQGLSHSSSDRIAVQKQPSTESDGSPTAWMRKPLPAFSSPVLDEPGVQRQANHSNPCTEKTQSQEPGIQRLRLNPEDGRYYSDASPVPADAYKVNDANDAFITVTSNDAAYGGHSTVFLEYFEDGLPQAWQIELSGTGDPPEFSVEPLGQGGIVKVVGSKGKEYKKTWKIDRDRALKAYKEATTIQGNNSQYQYAKVTVIQIGGRINCAIYAQKVLNAAGVNVSARALLGGAYQPDVLTETKTFTSDGSIPEIYSIANLNPEIAETNKSTTDLPEQYHTPAGIINAFRGTGINEETLGKLGKNFKRYWMYSNPMVRFLYLEPAISLLSDEISQNAINTYKEWSDSFSEENLNLMVKTSQDREQATRLLALTRQTVEERLSSLVRLVEIATAIKEPLRREIKHLRNSLRQYVKQEQQESNRTQTLSQPISQPTVKQTSLVAFQNTAEIAQMLLNALTMAETAQEEIAGTLDRKVNETSQILTEKMDAKLGTEPMNNLADIALNDVEETDEENQNQPDNALDNQTHNNGDTNTDDFDIAQFDIESFLENNNLDEYDDLALSH